jgi:integral membrane sensor domain MASE1
VAIGALLGAVLAGAPPVAAIAAGLGASASAAGGAWLLSRTPDFSPRLDRPRHILSLVAVGAFLAPIAGAALVALARWIDTPVDAASLVLDWTLLWSRDALGVMLVAPLILSWAAGPMPDARSARTLESVGLALLQMLAPRSISVCGGWQSPTWSRSPSPLRVPPRAWVRSASPGWRDCSTS